jgi:hypothetical protein
MPLVVVLGSCEDPNLFTPTTLQKESEPLDHNFHNTIRLRVYYLLRTVRIPVAQTDDYDVPRYISTPDCIRIPAPPPPFSAQRGRGEIPSKRLASERESGGPKCFNVFSLWV